MNVHISDELLAALDTAADERGMTRSQFVRWALGRVLSENEPYVYEPPTLLNWQVEAETLLLRGLFGDERLVLTDKVRALLEDAVTKLDNKSAQVLRMRFGLNGPRHTLAEVGNVFGVQRERVRQIETQALKRLRGLLRRSGIWEALEPQLESVL